MIGLLGRGENRGLGIQTWEFARHMHPSVLLLDVGDRFDPSRYPDATTVRFTGFYPEAKVRAWLDTVDVVYTAETTYSGIFGDWADEAGVDVVVHVNPEFHRDSNRATHWWAPTSWRLDHLPASTTVVPVPVATDRFTPAAPHPGPCRWLHIGGKPAMADRNGTEALLAAIPHLTRRCSITITTQSQRHITAPDNPLVDVTVTTGHDNYWEPYEGHDALVMPRRFGGLCLPVQEAMGAGLAVLMTDCSPNPQTWPVATVTARGDRVERMPVGPVDVAEIDPLELAQRMDEMSDPRTRHALQAGSRDWANDHSWSVWADRYMDLMTREVAA